MISFKNGKVYKDGKEVHLSTIEYELLDYLANYYGKPKHIEQIIGFIWSDSLNSITHNSVYNAIYKIRKKLGKDSIICIPKRGYTIGTNFTVHQVLCDKCKSEIK